MADKLINPSKIVMDTETNLQILEFILEMKYQRRGNNSLSLQPVFEDEQRNDEICFSFDFVRCHTEPPSQASSQNPAPAWNLTLFLNHTPTFPFEQNRRAPST